MGNDECRHVKWRVISPSVRNVEHPFADHDCPCILEGFVKDLGVGVRPAAGDAMTLAPARQFVHPLVEPLTPVAQGVPDAIVRPGDKAVQRHRHIYSNFPHDNLP
jgi:hypothetical protein